MCLFLKAICVLFREYCRSISMIYTPRDNHIVNNFATTNHRCRKHLMVGGEARDKMQAERMKHAKLGGLVACSQEKILKPTALRLNFSVFLTIKHA